ncbi:receptor-type tyrosine-protein phosphatase alpha isoform X1 [Hydra vulgaris]|uniref:receptor-type tyrosine-protein phosphatase alpha isoform X1 n=2 Tax=Hydra vulgaris TaxID=6087 RepID=UPI001F5E98E6|nr:receptor-type tyrosine-protein phosphatase alpha-like isoform X1 [Hydra vulgaris]
MSKRFTVYLVLLIASVKAENIEFILNPLSKPVAVIKWNVTADFYTVYFNRSRSYYINGGNTEFKTNTNQSETTITLDFGAEYSFTTTYTRSMSESFRSPTILLKTPDTPQPVPIKSKLANVLLLDFPNAKYHQLIVSKVKPSEMLPSTSSIISSGSILSSILNHPLKNLYVTLVVDMMKVPNVFLVGDNSIFVHNNIKVQNIPLEPNSTYVFFQRAFINDTDYFSFNWTEAIHTKPIEILNETEVVAITVGIVFSIISIIFIIIVLCHWKYSTKYTPKPPKKSKIEHSKRLKTDPCLPIKDSEFQNHMTHMKFNNFKAFNDEFSCMPVEACSYSEFLKLSDKQKKRFSNIPCYDKSRVISDDIYLHANYIPGFITSKDYIIMMSPSNEEIDAFWKMVWENNVRHIVMIGAIVEKKKVICAQYFPTNTYSLDDCSIKITLLASQEFANMVLRKFSLKLDDESRTVFHYQFLSWPSVQVTPHLPSTFLQFMLMVFNETTKNTAPIVVHSSYSSGSASIFACVDTQMRRIVKQNDVNVHSNVLEVRSYRHDGVQSLDEYIFIHECILEFILTRHFEDIPIRYLSSYIQNVNKSVPRFTEEFDFIVKNLCNNNRKSLVASLPCNKAKNTDDCIKPFDYNRVKLKKSNEEGSDYINASFIDTYLAKSSFIVVQTPNIDSMEVFWRMVYEMETWVIIMCCQEIEQGNLCTETFWPEEGFMMVFGDLSVKLVFEELHIKDVIFRRIQILNNKSGEEKLVVFYQYLAWPNDENISSSSMSSLVKIVEQSSSWKEKLKAKSIALVSSTGSGRPGVIIALRSLIEESSITGSVNIVRTVYMLRQQRYALIQTREEYSIIYSCTLELTKNIRRSGIISSLEPNVNTSKIGKNIFPDGYLNVPRKCSFISLNTIDFQMQQSCLSTDQVSMVSLPVESPTDFSYGVLGNSNEGYVSHGSDDSKSSKDTSF